MRAVVLPLVLVGVGCGSSPPAALDVDAGSADPPGTWRSALFPRGWRPLHAGGSADAAGRFLPDVSAAGWHRGEQRPPVGAGVASVIVDAALGDGITDAAQGIQDAVDAVCREGGGVVSIPAGTYRLRLPNPAADAVIRIACSRLILRGEGPDRTRLLFDDPMRARDVTVIAVRGEGRMSSGAEPRTGLAADVRAGSRIVRVDDASEFLVGQLVTVRNSNTVAFRAEHRMDEITSGEAGLWPSTTFWGVAYPRRIERISGDEVTLDAPIHYQLRIRDAAVMQALPAFIEEVGLESFSIGMTENLTTPRREESEADADYLEPGTTGYEVHRSFAVELDAVHDAWIHDVDSFAPAANTTTGSHLLSNGFLFEEGAFRITVSDCELGRPQYRGGGGNGYMFHFQGHDVLVVDARAERARHGFSFNHAATGNVLLRATTVRGRYSDDSHRFLANANVFDGAILDGAWLQAVNRGTTSSGAGFTSTGHVFWRTRVVENHVRANGCALESAQWGHGYLIGSSAGPGATARLCTTSFTNSRWAQLDSGDPVDYVEGEGTGDTLWPPSLFAAQLAARCTREGLDCTTW